MSGDTHAQTEQNKAAFYKSTAFEYVLCQLLYSGAGNAAKSFCACETISTEV